MPGILLGDVFPNFEAETTIGKIKFHEFLGNSWGILFSHPRDFTPVCTTELARAAKLHDEFKKRDVKMIALSIDGVEDHRKWSEVSRYYTHTSHKRNRKRSPQALALGSEEQVRAVVMRATGLVWGLGYLNYSADVTAARIAG
ncbi:peroxiredoxin-6-like [Sinocyclocheilus anshuiensis]|uniref:peroxiredoxin-6-like n=1 Tax=Sinocyclocheilus anshuiensis TaxID=1608454 RepID=UPI0007B9A35D|nr:PREDICTED: peroxiredoxin-6-like [Sinocyclocheilus anshuiensis]